MFDPNCATIWPLVDDELRSTRLHGLFGADVVPQSNEIGGCSLLTANVVSSTGLVSGFISSTLSSTGCCLSVVSFFNSTSIASSPFDSSLLKQQRCYIKLKLQ